MKTGKYTPEITECAVRMLIEIMCDTVDLFNDALGW